MDIMYNFGEILVLGLTYFVMRDVDGEDISVVLLVPYFFLMALPFFIAFYLKESPWYLSSMGRVKELVDTLNFISLQNLGKEINERERKLLESEKKGNTRNFLDVFSNVMKTENLITVLKLSWTRICLHISYLGSVFFIPFLFSSIIYI